MGLRETSFTNAYPHHPGARRRDTSEAAAEAMAPSAAYIQTRVLQAIRQRPMTSWEVAEAIGVAFETAQPRTSELLKLGLIEDSGERGPSRSPRHTAIRWRIVAPSGPLAASEQRTEPASGSDSPAGEV